MGCAAENDRQGNVIFKIVPYCLIADVVRMFLRGETDFSLYRTKAMWIALSFILAELLHSVSTTLSHQATFAVLANIRKMCCDKLARVSLGYVKDTPSGTFKNIMVERIDSIETTLAHIVPEFTSNLLRSKITSSSVVRTQAMRRSSRRQKRHAAMILS